MGFLSPAIPWIVKGGSALLGGLFSRNAQNAAQARSPEEQAAITGATGNAQALSTAGQGIMGAGLPAAKGALNYWQTLLSGNRNQLAMATAGPRAALTEQYQGAQRGLERSNLRGATKQLAQAQLTRDMGSKVAGLTAGVQPGAAQAAGTAGANLLQTGSGALAAGNNIYSNLLGQGFANRVYGRAEGADLGRSIGGGLFDMLTGTGTTNKLQGFFKNLGGGPSVIPGTYGGAEWG